MRKDSKVSDVLHVLLHMADHNEPLTSGYLAGMMSTNPVVVRRTLSGLREKGLVSSTKGRTGGWVLTCDLAEITLLQIYEAVGEPAIFAMGYRNESSRCLVEKAVNTALYDSLQDAERLLLERFAALSLQTLYEDFSRDMATVRASLDADERRALNTR